MKLFRKKLSKILNISGNKNFVAFLICVIFALIFWVLNTFDKSYDTTIPFSIKFSQPDDKVLKSAPPEAINLVIHATGWNIYKIRRLRKNYPYNPMTVDLEKYASKEYISTNEFRRKFFIRHPFDEVKIINITPDKIFIELENFLEKLVPVKTDLYLSFKKQYALSGPITINPSTVLIKGPESHINMIDTIYTDKLVVDDIYERTTKQLKLKKLPKTNVTFDTDKITVNIPVEELTEGRLTLPIKINANIKEKIILIPDKALITYQTAISNFNVVDTNTFYLYVDYEDIGIKESSKLSIKYTTNFEYIHSVRVTPEYVDYIIRK